MCKWFYVNKMSLNTVKTNHISFGRYKNVAMFINNITIWIVQATECFGVLIDELLNWKNHINMEKSKLSKVGSVMYKVKLDIVSTSPACVLYCSLVLSHS